MTQRHSISLGRADFDTRLCTLSLAVDHIVDVVAPPGSFAVFWRFDSWIAVLFAGLAHRSELSVDVVATEGTTVRVVRAPKWWPANLDPSPIQPSALSFAASAVSDTLAPATLPSPPAESVNRIEARSVQLNLLPETPEIQAKARAAAMFREFDRYTHPSFYDERTSVLPFRSDYASLPDGLDTALEYRFRKLVTTRVMPVLAERVATRWNDANTGEPPSELKKSYEVWLGYLSSLQLTFYRRWFGDLASAQGLSELASTFIWFGSGELLLRSQPNTSVLSATIGDISQGGPDGTAICLFVEFALAAIEADVDADVWARLLPALLAMIEAYAIAYGGRGPIFADQYPAAPIIRPGDIELRRIRDRAAARVEILGESGSDSGNAGFVAELAVEFAKLLRRMFSDGYSVTGVRAHLASEPAHGSG